MKQSVLYARVSSREQQENGYSIPAQIKLLEDYAQKNDFKIVKRFIDIETAKESGRTHFTEMIQYLEKNKES